MFWSLELARLLVQALPAEMLCGAWSSAEATPLPPRELEVLRGQVAELSTAEVDARNWVAEAWRSSHAEVIAATERLAIEELAAESGALQQRFGARELLFSVLTETKEDTAENVAILISALPAGRQGSAISKAWSELSAPAPTGSANPRRRLALVGGHASESERLRSLERRTGLRFDWIPADKRKGQGAAHEALADLREVNAIVIVTGNVSHPTMHRAKRAAERLGVPCGFVGRLTERRLMSCLETLSMERVR